MNIDKKIAAIGEPFAYCKVWKERGEEEREYNTADEFSCNRSNGIKLYSEEQVRAALAATHGAEVDELISMLTAYADQSYCKYIQQMMQPECKGVEYKIDNGHFDAVDLKGHTKAAKHLGAHQGIHEVISNYKARAALTKDKK